MSDEGIHLAQRERERWAALEIATDKAIRGDADFERRVSRVLGDCGPVLLRQGEDAENPSDRDGAIVLMDVIAEGADRRACRMRGREQGDGLRRCALGAISIGDAVPAARRARVFAEQLPARGIEEPHRDVVPLHVHIAADPAGWRAVVGRFDFDATVEVDGACPEAVVAKRLDRQRAERGPRVSLKAS